MSRATVARFLSMQDIILRDSTCAQIREASRESNTLAREIRARFPGRTRAGEYETAITREEYPDWKFALLLEDRNNRARRICVEDQEPRELSWMPQIGRLMNILEKPSWRETHTPPLRGDIIEFNRTEYFWNGARLREPGSTDHVVCIPREFATPREFPVEYFTGMKTVTHFTFDIARYREQILDSLIIKELPFGISYDLHFTEDSRNFSFRIYMRNNQFDSSIATIDFQSCDKIALSVISHVVLPCKKNVWILGRSIGLSS